MTNFRQFHSYIISFLWMCRLPCLAIVMVWPFHMSTEKLVFDRTLSAQIFGWKFRKRFGIFFCRPVFWVSHTYSTYGSIGKWIDLAFIVRISINFRSLITVFGQFYLSNHRTKSFLCHDARPECGHFYLGNFHWMTTLNLLRTNLHYRIEMGTMRTTSG